MHKRRGQLVFHRLGAAVALWGAVGAVGPLWAQDAAAPTAPRVDAAPLASEVELLLDLLKEPKLDLTKRREAALSLLRRADSTAQDQLLALLRQPPEPGVARLVAQALALLPGDPPVRFAPVLLALLSDPADPAAAELAQALGRYRDFGTQQSVLNVAIDRDQPAPRRAAVIAVLGGYRTQTVAGQLVSLLDSAEPASVRSAAGEALSQLTGLTNTGDNPTAWLNWWEQARTFNENDWLKHLLDNYAQGLDAAARRLRQTQQLLFDAQRQVYLATAAEERPALLVTMLGDRQDATRRLALDLVVQRLLAQEKITDELLAQIRLALDDPTAAVREKAARVLRDLRDVPGADAIAQRLPQETDPTVLRAYLLVLTGLPRAAGVEHTMALLPDPALHAEAAGALARAVDEGLLSVTQRETLRSRLNALIPPGDAPKPKVIELLGRVATPEDWIRIEQWLNSGDDAVKAAAGHAWAASERPLEALARRADDPILQPIVLTAAAQRGRSNETFLSLVRHRPTQEQLVQAWQRALVAMAGRVTPETVLDADLMLAENQAPPALRSLILSAALERPSQPEPLEPEKAVKLLMARADARLVAGQADAALTDLQQITQLGAALNDDQQRAVWRMSVRCQVAAGKAEAALEPARKLMASLHSLDDAGRAIAADSLRQLFIAAALTRLEANQPVIARQMLVAARLAPGPALSAELTKELDQLEAKIIASLPASAPESVAAPTPGSTPAAPASPAPAASPTVATPTAAVVEPTRSAAGEAAKAPTTP